MGRPHSRDLTWTPRNGTVIVVEAGEQGSHRLHQLDQELGSRVIVLDTDAPLEPQVPSDAALFVFDVGIPDLSTWSKLTNLAHKGIFSGRPILVASVRGEQGWVLGLSGVLAPPINPRLLWGEIKRLELPGGAKILIVDHNSTAVEAMSRRLEYEGFQVLCAADGETALEIARLAEPALVVINPLVPDRQGFATVEALRRMTNAPPCHIFLLLEEQLTDDDALWLGLQIIGASRNQLTNSDIAREVLRATSNEASRPSIQQNHASNFVLIVEDDPVYQRLLSVFLSDAGYQTKVAEDGVEALEIIRRETPSAVTLDLGLPEMDGFSVLEALRAEPAGKDLPVVILSGMADRGNVVGASAFLSKPFQRRKLVETLADLGVCP